MLKLSAACICMLMISIKSFAQCDTILSFPEQGNNIHKITRSTPFFIDVEPSWGATLNVERNDTSYWLVLTIARESKMRKWLKHQTTLVIYESDTVSIGPPKRFEHKRRDGLNVYRVQYAVAKDFVRGLSQSNIRGVAIRTGNKTLGWQWVSNNQEEFKSLASCILAD
jgi:hypothetical protein